jgi:hypothetical protein
VPLLDRSAAKIYISEMRAHVDRRLVPVFTPDTFIEVGDIGKLENGRFTGTGSLAELGLDPPVTERPAAGTDFSSSGKVSLGGSANVPGPVGDPILKATLKFNKDRAVATSFAKGVDRRYAQRDALDARLQALWGEGSLRADRVVVWQVRRATKGTVVVSEEGDNAVELSASAAALAPATALSLANIGLGVQFGSETKATWKLSDPDIPLTISIGLVRYSGGQVEDAFGFDRNPGVQPGAVVEVGVDDLLAQLD